MRFTEMTWPEIRRIDRQHSVVVCPIAACEQHGHHLPTFTDTILASAVAEGVERCDPALILLLPTLWLGASHHHLRLGATLSAEATTHVQMLVDLLDPLLEDGFKRILILNGHGGNIDTFHVALRQLQPRFRDRILCGASYWEMAAQEFAAIAEGQRKEMGHACEFETSMMLHLRPDLVRMEEIRNDGAALDASLRGLYLADDMSQLTTRGCVGYPEQASAEKGQQLLQAAVRRTHEVIAGLLRRNLPK
ncbi:MAG TPA: creatininase family protein [Gemmataceae bacterium]|jgi:creatinine amidohydrolase|nr:creatininase family protein [Gemmataceae bacterium]